LGYKIIKSAPSYYSDDIVLLSVPDPGFSRVLGENFPLNVLSYMAYYPPSKTVFDYNNTILYRIYSA